MLQTCALMFMVRDRCFITCCILVLVLLHQVNCLRRRSCMKQQFTTALLITDWSLVFILTHSECMMAPAMYLQLIINLAAEQEKQLRWQDPFGTIGLEKNLQNLTQIPTTIVSVLFSIESLIMVQFTFRSFTKPSGDADRFNPNWVKCLSQLFYTGRFGGPGPPRRHQF